MAGKREWFGTSKREIWQQLCKEIDADYVPGNFFGKEKVQAFHREWIMTLDTHTVSNGKTQTTYTRMRAPYVNWDDFRFRIYRKHVFSGIGKLFGMQDVEVGFPEFDEDFIIQGNDERKLRMLFNPPEIRELIQLQRQIHFEIRQDEYWFQDRFPEGVNELYFQVVGVIMDIDRLLALYDLFAIVLDHLCEIGSAYEDDPGFHH